MIKRVYRQARREDFWLGKNLGKNIFIQGANLNSLEETVHFRCRVADPGLVELVPTSRQENPDPTFKKKSYGSDPWEKKDSYPTL